MNPIYLRLIATGMLLDEDVDPAGVALRQLFTLAQPHLDPAQHVDLWTMTVDRVRRADENALEALRRAYLATLRRSVDEAYGIRSSAPEPVAQLAEVLILLGIMLAEFVTPVADHELARLWYLMSGKLATDDVMDQVDSYRSRLEKRGVYRPVMDEILQAWIANPREIQTWLKFREGP